MRFDEEGRSNYYHEYQAAATAHLRTGDEGRRELEEIAMKIKADGRQKRYDCILGLSGGVDSSYVALLASQLGLRPLAVHFDNGWNSEIAVQNVENIVSRLGFDLATLVIDWEEFRDLQVAYLRASVIDIEVVTDHAILATLYRLAAKNGIRHILSGTNVVTEQVMPPHWIYAKTDHVNIKAIHARFGKIPLRSYPFIDFRAKKVHQLVRRTQVHSILDLVDYDKSVVKRIIARDLGWKDYGGKHHESIFTRFYQSFILPTKFGVDKRKAHLSNLVFSGQMTKEEAVRELSRPLYDEQTFQRDYEFVLKKLRLTEGEFAALMKEKPRAHKEFAYERSIYETYPVLAPLRRTMRNVSYFLSNRS